MIHALVNGYTVLGDERYLQAAERAAQFLITKLSQEDTLLRRYRDGDSRFSGYIDDYAFFIQALISLFEATGRIDYIERAQALQCTQDQQFWDDSTGLYFHSAAGEGELIVRKKEVSDGAMPSGNAIAALNLHRLFGLTHSEQYAERAKQLVSALTAQAKRYPSAFASALAALDWLTDEPKELAVVGLQGGDARRELWQRLSAHYLPNTVVAIASHKSSGVVNLLADRPPLDGKPTYYVCTGNRCQAPTADWSEVEKELAGAKSLKLST